jgi:hydroxymethylpyrimidine pyrophosphatase-like HAD family hydrolase
MQPVPSGSDYDLCAVDLDGTLLSWQTPADRALEQSATPAISEGNIAALRRVHTTTSTNVVIATGRGPASATRVADEVLQLDCPLVCNNGACVLSARDATTGQRALLHASFYPREFVEGCCQAAAEVGQGTLICVYHPSVESASGCGISCCGKVPTDVDLGSINVMVCADEFPLVQERRLTPAQRDIVANSRNKLVAYDSYDALAQSEAAGSCYKLLVWATEPRRAAVAAQILERLRPADYGIQVLRPEVMLLEFVPPATNKATGLEQLLIDLQRQDDIDAAAGQTGAPRKLEEALLCFGDGANDAEMLSAARLSIAPANGGEQARQAATRVSRWAHHEDAVARELAEIYGWALD